jgi:ribosomal protein L37AE/L43A
MRKNDDFEKYTIINPDPTLKNNLMAFGLECDKGWYPLIYELLDKIQAIVDSNPEYKDLQVVQIKEKFGSLRMYLNYDPKEISDLIDEYERKSYVICEICGSNGVKRVNYGWYKTLCDKCYENWIR